jgi:hypothetical protein
MYRDDAEALLARADALQVEVDQLRAQLAEARAAYVPQPTATPPPIPKRAPRLREVTDAALVHQVTQELDRIPDSAVEPVPEPNRDILVLIGRLRWLDEEGVRAVWELVDELWRTRRR